MREEARLFIEQAKHELEVAEFNFKFNQGVFKMDNGEAKLIKKAIKAYLKKINKKFKLERSILFGSRARGDYINTSDVDMIIVSKDFSKLTFRERMVEAISYWDGNVDLEVICYTPEEFEKKKKQIGIVKTAVEEGIEIK